MRFQPGHSHVQLFPAAAVPLTKCFLARGPVAEVMMLLMTRGSKSSKIDRSGRRPPEKTSFGRRSALFQLSAWADSCVWCKDSAKLAQLGLFATALCINNQSYFGFRGNVFGLEE
jgi:hypothetical protein